MWVMGYFLGPIIRFCLVGGFVGVEVWARVLGSMCLDPCFVLNRKTCDVVGPKGYTVLGWFGLSVLDCSGMF